MNKNNIKVFFWVFGIIFSAIAYYLIYTLPSFNYIKEVYFLPYLIVLIILILFFLIGVFFSKFPLFWYSKLRTSNINEVLGEVNSKNKEENINELVKKLKLGISILSKSNYSEASINYLITNIGISREYANKIILNIKKLKRLKTASIFMGLFLSVTLYLVVTNLSMFDHISKLIFVISAVVIFLLFVIEGYLITRMPDSFYLNLININRSQILESQKEFSEKKEKINSYTSKQKDLLGDVKKATKFLLNQNVEREAIIGFFSKYNLDEKTILGFIESSQKEIDYENKLNSENNTGNVLFKDKSDSAIKLTLSKIHDSFEQINQIYNEVTKLQQEVSEISERQKKLENMSTLNVSKEVKKLKKETIIKEKFKGIDQIKKADPEVIKSLLEKKNLEYEKLISYLYHLFLPYVETSSQNDVFSTLVYYGYPYEVVEDVLQKFKDKKIVFGKDKNTSLTERIVNRINSFYDLFSK